ncbi:MAG: autotransporter domain-containing protein [Alphaproteobacteria bacterium]|nr:autotransporter domain-containing protein [Alphaproteobacteria bacterium]
MALTAATSTHAADSLLIIGDSLSDPGNLFAVTGGTQPPSPPYFSGRFSNGPVYAETLPGLLNVETTATTNLAFGGATSGSANSIDALNQVNTQVTNVTTGATAVTPDAVAVYFIGANDLLNNAAAIAAGTADAGTVIGQTTTNIATGVGTLNAIGYRRFLVANLPNLGDTPGGVGSGSTASLNQLTSSYNEALNATVAGLETATGADITVVDINGLFTDILTNPSLYGLSNTSVPCVVSGVETGACPTDAAANATAFFDEIHPTATVHNAAADYFAATYDIAENSGADMAARADLGLQISRSQQRLAQARLLSVRAGINDGAEERRKESTAVFVLGDYGSGERDQTSLVRGFDYDVISTMAGIDFRVGKGSVGAAVGYARGSQDLEGNRGEADSDSYFGLVYGTFGGRRTYVDLSAGYSFDQYDFNRPTQFSARPTASADTDGSSLFGTVTAGYNFLTEDTAVGPLVGARWTRSRVDGYTEDAGPLALTVEETDVESLVGYAGAQATVRTDFTDGGFFAAHISAVAEQDFGGEESVSASLPSGETVNGTTEEGDFGIRITAGIEIGFTEAIRAQFVGETSVAQDSGSDFGLQGRLVMNF